MAALAVLPALLIAAGAAARFQASPAPGGESVRAAPREDLVYVSDYFSFIGRDAHGRVAFAIDNNRGRDGDAWQAEHFVALHDEGQGWVEVKGSGGYENKGRDLETIPDSAFFRFRGTVGRGMRIVSRRNRLTLSVGPIQDRLSRVNGSATYRMGSGRGRLDWAGRALEGRVIYEYLRMPGFNRLTRSYPDLWKDFHGLYLSVEGRGDLYLHSQKSPLLRPLLGDLAGFAFLDGDTVALDRLELNVSGRAQARGAYRWPVGWRGRWHGARGGGAFTIELSDLRVVNNWVFGGFSLGIAQGELVYGRRARSLYGLAELLV